MNPPPDPLDDLLDCWGSAPKQPTLVHEVARRLRRADAPEVLPWWRRLDRAFARSSFAVAFVVACALLGLFLAELRVSRVRGERDRQLAESYLQLIDPLLANAVSKPHPSQP